MSVFDQAGRTGVAEHITRLEDKCEAAVAENSWLRAEMDRIYAANNQREDVFEKIAPPPGWMFNPVFHAGAPPEQPVMPVGQGDRPASDQDEQPVAVEPVIQATASSQKPKPSRPKPARIVTVSRAVAVPAVTAAPRQAATPPRRDSIDSFRGSRMSSRQSNHELVTVQSSDEESTAAQFSPVNEVESENDFSTKSEGSQAQAAVAYSSRGRYRGKGKAKARGALRVDASCLSESDHTIYCYTSDVKLLPPIKRLNLVL